MTRFERIQQIQVGGVRPFKPLPASAIATTLTLINCQDCWIGRSIGFDTCQRESMTCFQRMNKWLLEEADE